MLAELQIVPLFAGLAEADVKALTEGAEVLEVATETLLWKEGDPADRFVVVLAGHVEMSVDKQGRRSVVEIAGTGTVLGEAALFGGEGFSMSARALPGTRLLSIPARPFCALLEQRFDLMRHMLSSMSFRLRLLVRKIAELKLKSTAQRLGSFLLSLAGDAAGPVRLRFPYDKRLVAEELGMQPESLSRALSKLARLGVETGPDNAVVIADLAPLREFCLGEDLG